MKVAFSRYLRVGLLHVDPKAKYKSLVFLFYFCRYYGKDNGRQIDKIGHFVTKV